MRRSSEANTPTTLSARVRVGHDPRTLARVLKRGEIAIIDRADLDAASAELLADREPACVINVSPSLTGRFEARGASTLLARSIPLVDATDRTLIAAADGDEVSVDFTVEAGSDGRRAIVTSGPGSVECRVVDAEHIESRQTEAKAASASRLPRLTASALDLVQRDGPALVDGDAVPHLELDLAGKDVLVVTAGPGYKNQLAALRRVVRELRPVVIVTGDAANVVAEHHGVDVIVGPIEGVSDEVLSKASRVVVHGESNAVATTRLGALGVRHVSSASRLESADLAVALAASAGARLIATVGIDTAIPDLVDSAQGASALLARVAAGPAWIDGRMLARIHRSRWSRLQGWLVVVLAALAAAAALALHPQVRDVVTRVTGLG
ncbi:putative cytokinetic ring protein SteA [Demequina sp.]|uniref:putative cytokinetic ring protein SteA n=1 Tax=Demequina sp. TaxID=2050685 RepID=UPI0025B8C898|nr:putative cytokinetic ring protein SteA [Demequina sp.]